MRLLFLLRRCALCFLLLDVHGTFANQPQCQNTASKPPWAHFPESRQMHCQNESASERRGTISSIESAWSLAPVCIQGDVSEYCVYTSTVYNAGHGVSVIARPEEERSLSLVITDPRLTEHGARYLANASGLPYEIREIAGKGRGLFALRNIQPGETFLVGFPVIVIDQELELGLDEGLTVADRAKLYKLAFEQLTVPERALSLASSSEFDIYEDIIMTNGFSTRLGSRRYTAVFPEIAVRLSSLWQRSLRH